MLDVFGVTDTERRELLESLEAGFALPSSWYTDRTLFDQERRRLLRRGWHYGAHTGELSEPGDQALCQVAGVPVVLVAGEDGEIRGFVNICRHRAHIVVNEPGNRRTLQCMYHGWTYNLDGCLRRAPRAETELEFDPAEFGLIPVQTAVWGPMVWVNVDRDAPGFFDWIGGLPELVATHGLDLEAQQYAFEGEWEIPTNWKVFLDNAIECYHCPTCHPGLADVLEMDPELHKLSVGGRYWISHEVPFRKSATDVSDYYGMTVPTNGARLCITTTGSSRRRTSSTRCGARRRPASISGRSTSSTSTASSSATSSSCRSDLDAEGREAEGPFRHEHDDSRGRGDLHPGPAGACRWVHAAGQASSRQRVAAPALPARGHRDDHGAGVDALLQDR